MTENTNNSTRASRTRGLSRSAGFYLQERDVAIVEAVHRHRVLTTKQIAALFFGASYDQVSSACRTRLRHLARSGYLERAEQLQTKTEGRKPYLYMLTAPGADLLVEELGYEPGEIDWRPEYNNVGWPFLRHQIDINHVYVAFAQASPGVGWSLERWIDDRILRKHHSDRVFEPHSGREVAVVPDAYFALVGPGGAPVMHFFLEVDRATTSVVASSRRVKSWQDKIRAYQAYFDSGAMEKRYDTRRIRVLAVTTGRTRLSHLKEATELVGGRRRYWFSTLEEVASDAVLTSPIWWVAAYDQPLALISR